MATRNPQLPRPLQPLVMQSTSPPPTNPCAALQHPLMGNLLHPQASLSDQYLSQKGGLTQTMIKTPGPNLNPRQSPVHHTTIIQHNSLGSWDVFLSLFGSLVRATLIEFVVTGPLFKQRLPPPLCRIQVIRSPTTKAQGGLLCFA